MVTTILPGVPLCAGGVIPRGFEERHNSAQINVQWNTNA